MSWDFLYMDCIKTLHMIMRDPDELKRAQADFAVAWLNAMRRGDKARPERFKATGEGIGRILCPVARNVILKTEKNWSEK